MFCPTIAKILQPMIAFPENNNPIDLLEYILFPEDYSCAASLSPRLVPALDTLCLFFHKF